MNCYCRKYLLIIIILSVTPKTNSQNSYIQMKAGNDLIKEGREIQQSSLTMTWTKPDGESKVLLWESCMTHKRIGIIRRGTKKARGQITVRRQAVKQKEFSALLVESTSVQVEKWRDGTKKQSTKEQEKETGVCFFKSLESNTIQLIF